MHVSMMHVSVTLDPDTCMYDAYIYPDTRDSGLLLRIWLKQGKERILLARILEFLEKVRKRLSRQNSTIKVRKCE